jgi:gluconolactonase
MTKKCIYTSFRRHPFYTEGPVMDTAGNWYFTNLAGGAIIRINTEGTESIWATTDCPNGQAILSNGHHLVCDSKAAALVRFDQEGNFIQKTMNKSCAGEIIKVPNDVITDKKGNIYFTDSVRYEGKVGRISAAGKESVIARDLDYPNGLALSTDEKTLFVAESYKNRIIAFDLNEDGQAENGFRILANLPCHPSNNITSNLPDGIKVDDDNNIWVAHYGMGMIHKLNPKGDLVESLKTPFDLVSNLFIQNNKIIVTGGFGEPGPGGIIAIDI